MKLSDRLNGQSKVPSRSNLLQQQQQHKQSLDHAAGVNVSTHSATATPTSGKPTVFSTERQLFHPITLHIYSKKYSHAYASLQSEHLQSLMEGISFIHIVFFILAAINSSLNPLLLYPYIAAIIVSITLILLLRFKFSALTRYGIAIINVLSIASIAFTIENRFEFQDDSNNHIAVALFVFAFILVSINVFPWQYKGILIIYAAMHYTVRVSTKSHTEIAAEWTIALAMFVNEYLIERNTRMIFCTALALEQTIRRNDSIKNDIQSILKSVIPMGVFICSIVPLNSPSSTSTPSVESSDMQLQQNIHLQQQQVPRQKQRNYSQKLYATTQPIGVSNSIGLDFANAKCLEDMGCENPMEILNRLSCFKGVQKSNEQNQNQNMQHQNSMTIIKNRSNSNETNTPETNGRRQKTDLRQVISEYLYNAPTAAAATTPLSLPSDEQSYSNVLYQNGFSDSRYFDIKLIRCTWQSRDACLCVLNMINEKVINERQNRLEEFEKRIVSTITHNLKTPLNGIILLLQCVLQQAEGMSEQIQSLIEDVYTNSELLLNIINDVLDYSKIQQGTFKLTHTRFRIDSLLTEVSNLYKTQLNKKQISLFLDHATISELQLFTDYDRLKQVLLNLTGNALKFTFSGHIKIVVRESREDINVLEIQVQDTGSGISKEIKQALLHQSSTHKESDPHAKLDKQSGSGIGLSMCQCLVEKLGPYSKLFIQSAENEGTRITFFIYRNINRKRQATYSAQNSIRSKKKSMSMKPTYMTFLQSSNHAVVSPSDLTQSILSTPPGNSIAQLSFSGQIQHRNQDNYTATDALGGRSQVITTTSPIMSERNSLSGPPPQLQSIEQSNTKTKQVSKKWKNFIPSKTLSIFQGHYNRRRNSGNGSRSGSGSGGVEGGDEGDIPTEEEGEAEEVLNDEDPKQYEGVQREMLSDNDIEEDIQNAALSTRFMLHPPRFFTSINNQSNHSTALPSASQEQSTTEQQQQLNNLVQQNNFQNAFFSPRNHLIPLIETDSVAGVSRSAHQFETRSTNKQINQQLERPSAIIVSPPSEMVIHEYENQLATFENNNNNNNNNTFMNHQITTLGENCDTEAKFISLLSRNSQNLNRMNCNHKTNFAAECQCGSGSADLYYENGNSSPIGIRPLKSYSNPYESPKNHSLNKSNMNRMHPPLLLSPLNNDLIIPSDSDYRDISGALSHNGNINKKRVTADYLKTAHLSLEPEKFDLEAQILPQVREEISERLSVSGIGILSQKPLVSERNIKLNNIYNSNNNNNNQGELNVFNLAINNSNNNNNNNNNYNNAFNITGTRTQLENGFIGTGGGISATGGFEDSITETIPPATKSAQLQYLQLSTLSNVGAALHTRDTECTNDPTKAIDRTRTTSLQRRLISGSCTTGTGMPSGGNGNGPVMNALTGSTTIGGFVARSESGHLQQIRNQLENKSILIVDDTMFNVIALKSLLINATNSQINIDEAYNGEQAVEKVTARGSELYDLIFMDINMPVMDGLQATESIKQINRGNRIIIVTAFSDETDRTECTRFGADGFLAKPVRIKDLATQIHRVNTLYSQTITQIVSRNFTAKDDENMSDRAIPSPEQTKRSRPHC